MFKSMEIKNKNFYYNRLYRDYILNFEKVCRFYEYDYRKIDSYAERLSCLERNYEDKIRTKLCSILKNYNTGIGCSQKTLKNIEKLKNKKSAVVVGGQQPGYLTGPVFIIFKLLTIIKLSSRLEDELNTGVIPCFWNASDDSSPQQVDSLNLISGNEIKNLKVNLSGIKPDTRYSDIFLSRDRFENTIGQLEDILYPTDFKPEIIDFFKKRVDDVFKNLSDSRGRINISAFFSNLVSKLFSDYGIVIIDPADVRLKELSFDILEFDMDNHRLISDLINSAGKELKSAGYHSQLSSMPETLDFFYCKNGIRDRIHSEDGNIFKINNKESGRGELMSFLRENPSKISLNVVLRPLFQDKFFPVLASVCGPGESGYFAQLKPVYDLYNLKMPVIYPRFSATIIEKKIKKIMSEFDVTGKELEKGRDNLIKELIDRRTKVNLPELIDELESNIMSELDKLEGKFKNYNMNISTSFDRIKRNTGKEIKVLNKKIYAGLKKRDKFIAGGIDKIYLNIFPDNDLQERKINIITYLNKYGFSFIDRIYSGIKPFSFTHKFLEIT